MDIEMDGVKIGRIIFGLFGSVAPKATENFAALCKCDRGVGPITGKDLCYKGSNIHRVVPNFGFQGGDFTHGDGRGGESIYGGYFDDESFQVKHNRAYMLSMANSGRNTNGSQFFITTVKTDHLDGRHVGCGVVEEGWDIVGILNNDMIGNIEGIDGVIDNTTFRVFSEPTPANSNERDQIWNRFYGGEVDGLPTRPGASKG